MACIAVKEDGMTQNKAAKLFHIPRSTLGNALRNELHSDSSKKHERAMKDHVDALSVLGYHYSKVEFYAVAAEYTSRSKNSTSNGMDLVKKCLDKFPDTLFWASKSKRKTREPLSMERYWIDLESVLMQYEFFEDKAHLVYSFGEMITLPDCTVYGCANAAGKLLPPFIAYKKTPPSLSSICAPEGTGRALMEDKIQRPQMFRKFLNHLLTHVQISEEEKALLFVSGWFVSVGLKQWALDKNIEVLVLPAHGKRILSPLDAGCRDIFEERFRQIQNYAPKANVLEVACKIYSTSLSAKNVQDGFRHSGVLPFNRNVQASF